MEEKLKNFYIKKSKGITLVALIITIIVLIILAGVSISILSGDNGILNKAVTAKEKNNYASDLENNNLNQTETILSSYFGDSHTISQGPLLADVADIGDFVKGFLGNWTDEDFSKIESSGLNVNKSIATPSVQGQFGGFTNITSKDGNATPYVSSYDADFSGWRVWSIDTNTKEVVLISAGCPETYFHGSGNSNQSKNILKNTRNWTMYENDLVQANSAKCLNGEEAVSWYNSNIGGNFTIIDNGSTSSTWYLGSFVAREVKPNSHGADKVTVIDNGTHYWFSTAYDSSYLYFVHTNSRHVHATAGIPIGIRVLVTLKPIVIVTEGTGALGDEWQISK